MPWRFIGTIAILVILMVFVGFNIQNTCDISFGFTTLPNVPVYLTVFFSFVLGVLFSLPFFILGILKKKSKTEKKPWFRKKDTQDTENPATGETPAEAPKDTPFGID